MGQGRRLAIVAVKQKRGLPALGAIVDDDMVDVVRPYPWSVCGLPAGNFHARANVGNAKRNRTLYLHHLVLPAKKGFLVDHINRNQLDNRRVNLRYLTPAQSLQNTSVRGHSRTGIRNVMRRPPNKYYPDGFYVVRVRADGVPRSRICKTEAEAVAAARELRLKHLPYSYEGSP